LNHLGDLAVVFAISLWTSAVTAIGAMRTALRRAPKKRDGNHRQKRKSAISKPLRAQKKTGNTKRNIAKEKKA